jgi:hypothetical protein
VGGKLLGGIPAYRDAQHLDLRQFNLPRALATSVAMRIASATGSCFSRVSRSRSVSPSTNGMT